MDRFSISFTLTLLLLICALSLLMSLLKHFMIRLYLISILLYIIFFLCVLLLACLLLTCYLSDVHITFCWVHLSSIPAFQDSSLLGKIHVALLRILISDVQAELSSGFSPDLSKSCNFLALLHSVSIKPLNS